VLVRLGGDLLPEGLVATPRDRVGRIHLVVRAQADALHQRVNDAVEIRHDALKRRLAVVLDGAPVPLLAARTTRHLDDPRRGRDLRTHAKGDLTRPMDHVRHGILPKGRVLQSPCGSFFLQLIEPEPGILDVDGDESLQRLGLGTPDVLATVQALRERGVGFVESHGVHSDPRGALTQSYLGGVMFELVHHEAP